MAVKQETMTLNMGPQHPSTHGVLRLVLNMEGETILEAQPVIGYLHTGIEKEAETKTYHKVVTLNDRLDYVGGMFNNLAYSMCIEKLLGATPPPRGEHLRVLIGELQRIASHLVWFGTHTLDLGVISGFFYAFREREKILDLFESLCGARLTYTYFIPGGVRYDLPDGWVEKALDFCSGLPAALDEMEAMVTENPIWLQRTKGVGVLSAEDAINLGVTGPALRGSGVEWDLRKTMPYSSYDHFDFNICVEEQGDVYARYLVRMREMRESLKIVQQAIDTIPDGPTLTEDYSFVPPPKERLDNDMEALIRHFLFYSRGYSVPEGEAYVGIEGARGEIGYFIVSDGSEKPYRMHMRSPSFVNLSALPSMANGQLLADMVAVIGSIDIVLGEIDR